MTWLKLVRDQDPIVALLIGVFIFLVVAVLTVSVAAIVGLYVAAPPDLGCPA